MFYDEAINREDIKMNPYQSPEQAEILYLLIVCRREYEL